MAKELPYFQFEPAEYLTGDISFCSLSAQGLFTILCSYYWQRSCKLTKEQFLRRIDSPKEFQELEDENVIKVNNGSIEIKFLDEQLDKVLKQSKTNSINGSKGGRPRKQNPIETETKPKKNPIETETKGIREDKIREDNTYTETDFIKDWNETRTEVLKKPSYIKTIPFFLKDDLTNILNNYEQKDIITALKGLFKQKNLPNNNTSMQSDPKHFIQNFERYLQAGTDMNPHIYGNQDV